MSEASSPCCQTKPKGLGCGSLRDMHALVDCVFAPPNDARTDGTKILLTKMMHGLVLTKLLIFINFFLKIFFEFIEPFLFIIFSSIFVTFLIIFWYIRLHSQILLGDSALEVKHVSRAQAFKDLPQGCACSERPPLCCQTKLKELSRGSRHEDPDSRMNACEEDTFLANHHNVCNFSI